MSDLPLFAPPPLDSGETETHAQDQAEIQAQQRAADEENAAELAAEVRAVMARTIHRRRIFRVTRTDAAGELFINTVAEYSPEAAIDFCKDWDAEDARAPFNNYTAEERSGKRA